MLKVTDGHVTHNPTMGHILKRYIKEAEIREFSLLYLKP